MNSKITSFYRLTKQEKEALVEQCRKKIEEEKVRETETVRKILEELLDTKWENKKKTAQKGMQAIVDDLQRQVMEAQAHANRNVADAGELQKKLTEAETKSGELQKKLTEAETRSGELQEKLTRSEETVDTLRRLQTISGTTISDLQAKQSAAEQQIIDLSQRLTDSEEEKEHLQNELAAAQETSDKNNLLKDSYRNDTGKLRAELRMMKKKLPGKRFRSGLAGVLAGILLMAVLGVFAVPVRYAEGYSGAEQKMWCTGEPWATSVGYNLFGEFTGCLNVESGDEVQFVDFIFNGTCVCIWDYRFPGGGVYCGGGFFDEPRGPGVYTYSNGERSFGIWEFTEDMEYVMNNKTYSYAGMLRSGAPYGYGVLKDSEGERRFAGEFRGGSVVNGTWINEDGTSMNINNQ